MSSTSRIRTAARSKKCASGAAFPFHYPDRRRSRIRAIFNFDCEAMIWRSGWLYLLTKHRSDFRTTLYRLDPNQTTEQVAVRLGETEIGSPVTGADCRRDGKTVVVLSYQYLHVFEWRRRERISSLVAATGR
jgi:hypothetical protein